MAIANLLIKIGADISELKTGSDKAVATIEKASSKIDTLGSSIKSSILSAFSVGAVISFGKELVSMADNIVRTADRTGLLTEEVQKLSFIADQSGNSIDELTSGIGQLQNKLASGDKSALAAVDQLGLSFDKLRTQSPFEQLSSIATAIQKVENPAVRAQIAMDLFGKTGIAILPTLTSNFKQLGDTAPHMTDKTTRGLEAAGDAFEQFALQIKVWVAESYNFFGRVMDAQIAGIYKLIAGMYDATAAVVKLTAKIPGASKVFGDLTDNVASLTESSRWYRDAANALTTSTTKSGAAAKSAVIPFTALTAVHKAAAPAAKKHAEALADIPPVVNGLSEEFARALPPISNYQDAAHKLADELIGWDKVSRAEDVIAGVNVALQMGVPIGKLSAETQKTINKAVSEAIDVYTRLGLVAPQAMRDLYVATVAMPPVLDGIAAGTTFGDKIDEQGTKASTKVVEVKDHLGALAQALTQLAQVSGGTFGGIAKGLATLVTGVDTVIKGFDSFRDGIKNFKSGSTWEGLMGLTSGIAGIISAAISAGKVLFDLFDRNKGRDLVVDFAKTMGGFDALHIKLLELGEEGERLWIALTQGVGRNNPQQAQAAIDAVTAALNKQNKESDKAQAATEEQAQATIETAAQASLALEELGGKISGNVDAWADWSHRVTGYLDDVARSIRALPSVGSPSGEAPEVPGFATGTRGQYLNFGSGSLVMLHGRERVSTESEDLGVGGDIYVSLDAGELWDQRVVRVSRRDATRGGLRTRAAPGRGY